jgi:hypothetical protein
MLKNARDAVRAWFHLIKQIAQRRSSVTAPLMGAGGKWEDTAAAPQSSVTLHGVVFDILVVRPGGR